MNKELKKSLFRRILALDAIDKIISEEKTKSKESKETCNYSLAVSWVEGRLVKEIMKYKDTQEFKSCFSDGVENFIEKYMNKRSLEYYARIEDYLDTKGHE
jgi:hypothetical protein